MNIFKVMVELGLSIGLREKCCLETLRRGDCVFVEKTRPNFPSKSAP